jgi:hypothetical protein
MADCFSAELRKISTPHFAYLANRTPPVLGEIVRCGEETARLREAVRG